MTWPAALGREMEATENSVALSHNCRRSFTAAAQCDVHWTPPRQKKIPSMRTEDILKLPSMPAAGPSYTAGPYRFVDREFMVITYETDPDVIAAQFPDPLEPIQRPRVHYEWIKMPDSSGFGSYTESGMVLPCRFRGEDVNFSRPDVSRRRPADRGGARDLGLSQEVRPSEARDRQGYLDRHAVLRRATGRDGDNGLQARKH